jgi:hypothetical protein
MDKPVRGYLERLDDTRLVFIGQRDNDLDTFYVGFRSAAGVDTTVKLSKEALDALMRLRLMLIAGKEPKHDFPHGTTWKHHWVVTENEFD